MALAPGERRGCSRIRVSLWFSLDGDIRFISHRDSLRLFARAAKRADLPIRYSQGFNPRPRIWLPLPRPVGVASDAELLLLELSRPVAAEQLKEALSRQMPRGIVLREALLTDPQFKAQPRVVRYTMPLRPEQAERLAPRLAALSAREAMAAEDQPTDAVDGRGRRLDRYLQRAELDSAGAQLLLELRVAPDGTARPADLLSWLGLPPRPYLAQLRRRSVQYE